MKNNFKKVIVIMLIVAISLSTIAFADEFHSNEGDNQNRASAYISNYSGKIKPTGSGHFNIIFTVTGTGTMTQLGATHIRIFKNGTQVDSFWYTSAGRSNMMAYNTYIMGDTESYSGVSGASYYAKITFFAKNSSGSDAIEYTTAAVTV